MTTREFAAAIKPYNIKYCEMFGYIPKITDFSCGREEYIEALKKSIDEKISLDFIIPCVIPADKNNYS